ncbi:MAG TPA: hypothetical protein VIK32_04815 [Candidatus Limnocylindrales bacterium]
MNDTIIFPARKVEGALERIVRRALGKADGDITQAEFDEIKKLWLGGNQLTSVEGLVLPAGLVAYGLKNQRR